MLQLNKEELKGKKDQFTALGIKTPEYDFEKVWEATKKSPIWLHFGGGNLFRAHHSVLQQHLIEKTETDRGIIVVSTNNVDLVEKVYHPHDNLSLSVVMKTDGTLDMEVIASVAESIATGSGPDAWERLKEIVAEPSLQLVTFTITEKGYDLKDLDGEIRTAVKEEIEQGLDHPKHTMVMLAALLHNRYLTGQAPLALVSTDNFSHNGDKLKAAVLTVATAWNELGFVARGFLDYLKNEVKLSFPWSMIDKIVPVPSEQVSERLKTLGYGSAELIRTKPNRAPIAPFVNGEEAEYLVIEDRFPNGRPALEKVGVYFTDREVVDQVERMKVCTCLNPLHTALAVFGCLLDYRSIAAEMQDEDLKALIEKIGYVEGMKTVTDPGIIKPSEFIKEVIEVRFPNPNNPDTPQRIASDTSQKLAIRFGETIKAYMQRADLDVNDLTFIPLTIAAWCRYLLGVNDQGEEMKLSPDPLLQELQEYMKNIKFGRPDSVGDNLRPILSNKKIFGVDLYEAGLGEKIEEFFKRLIKEKGAVRATLHQQLGE
ncbi:mannitol dehydrogenase family protein [Neobacillus sp. PS3-12]|uniref:mannitol dehydrogenase family protein n=1 Tax=Neobacillus sp. PS3-12 TaxID=3070677 RepID=UPI0027DEABCA|nr:mannitol dehydrogenase family protein [Neobacillus sp. PS3-12]WML55236.1 mannitol dehydrogenase family protein [Neobacillus sp. PS3-12]